MSKITIYQPEYASFRVEDSIDTYYRDDFKQAYQYEGNDKLEEIFEKFNINRPEDFQGHSLSVGDIVSIDDKLYICCNFGWKDIKWGERKLVDDIHYLHYGGDNTTYDKLLEELKANGTKIMFGWSGDYFVTLYLYNGFIYRHWVDEEYGVQSEIEKFEIIKGEA